MPIEEKTKGNLLCLALTTLEDELACWSRLPGRMPDTLTLRRFPRLPVVGPADEPPNDTIEVYYDVPLHDVNPFLRHAAMEKVVEALVEYINPVVVVTLPEEEIAA